VTRRYTARLAGSLVVLALAAVGASGCSSGKSHSTSSAGSSGSAVAALSSKTFDGVTVAGVTDLANKPKVSAKSSDVPSSLMVQDLVLGDGAAATPTSTVTVQYVGVLYPNGKQFDSSWDHNGAVSFSLQQVVPGFAQGIGGNSQIAPMKVGARRIMILPPDLGYGAAGTPDGSIPPNTPIVFVVDLIGIS
jgi:peptidylprolyl isomerase